MKKLAFYLFIVLVIASLPNCTEDHDAEPQPQTIWGAHWEGYDVFLKSFELSSRIERSFPLKDFNYPPENLVYNHLDHELLFTSINKGALFRMNLDTREISKILNLGHEVYGLKLDPINKALYGLITTKGSWFVLKIDLEQEQPDLIASIPVPAAEPKKVAAAINPEDNKYYIAIEDSLYMFDYQKEELIKSLELKIVNLDYNPVHDILNGVYFTDYYYHFAWMDPDLSNLKSKKFTKEISAVGYNSTVNTHTGEYLFQGNGYEMHIVEQHGIIRKTMPVKIEDHYEFQGN